MSISRGFRALACAGGLLLTPACLGEPFSYADDRCVGGYNQCENSCASLGEGPARAACADRCLSSETRCYYGKSDESGAALAVDRAIGEKRSQQEKEDAYRAWKAQKEKESADKQEAEQEEGDSGDETTE